MNNFENRRVLIIDDDTRIHEDFIKILGEKDSKSEYNEIEAKLFSDEVSQVESIVYELDSAYQGEEGYEKVLAANSEGRPYAMAFIDMRMPPGWDGLETIKQIWQIDSQIQLVICTAYSDYSWNEVLYHLGASDRLIILKKPFDMVEVQQLTTALTTKWSLSCESISRLQQIEESEEKYRTVVDSVEDTIMTLDKEGNIMFVNHNPWNMINQAVGGNYYYDIKDEYREKVKQTVEDVFSKGEQKNIEYATSNGVNKTVWSEGRLTPNYKNNKVVAATLIASDISARKALDWQLRHDELTGLANRTQFSDYVKSCLANKDSEELLVILFIDLDHFNLINDCFGHELGDKLLVRISKLLSKKVDENEMLARLGGDEFAILKCVNKDDSWVHKYAESLNDLLKQPLTVAGFDIYPSASIGVVVVKDTATTVTSLLQDADAALYHAKSKGRNRYECFDQKMRDEVVKRVSMGNELRQAIENDQFEAYYQPFTNLSKGRVTGFEALIRWNHPIKGMIYPDEFIPVAEETGLIFSITKKMLMMGCSQIKEWQDMGLGDIVVSINCSARDFNEQNMQQIIEETIKETGADIKQLELELTESTIMDDAENSIECMRLLTDMGLNISIDDFGTGYSSFSYIKQFTIDKLKIDRTFICDTPQVQDDVAIVEAIIAMAHRLKIKVVAEGVETAEQLAFLQTAKCDVIQGYLLGKPMSSEEATSRLQQGDWPNQELIKKI
ncbi:MAG: EAL domain-containing protein [Gammaproteobacteria bacterium]|nr:EAL domain-containing protein [Gammaproteobacteria bacterium]